MDRSQIDFLSIVKISAAVASLGFAVWSDLKSRKISNRTNLIIFAIGILASLLHDPSNALELALSVLTATAIIMPVYILKILGGGDAKLFIALSTFLTPQGVLECFVASLIWGSILGLLIVINKSQLSGFVSNIKMLFYRQKPANETLHKIPFSVAIAFAYLTHLVLRGSL
jgi:prepilin peptidase CpaA